MTTYAGDVSPKDTWQRLAEDPRAVLIDVRTRAEWSYVGVPDLATLGKEVVKLEWQTWPDGAVNPGFADAVAQAGIDKDQPVLLLCRSGVRSKAAAEVLTGAGWQRCFNILGGFEGPHDATRHRGTVAGWKHDALPWTQG
ncbi:MAG TPA: rhodanese-like domain-containing protein [Stellaceae bacterium]|nr:rhodanese-like domain-containing protein [Stellaceae bacterium]